MQKASRYAQPHLAASGSEPRTNASPRPHARMLDFGTNVIPSPSAPFIVLWIVRTKSRSRLNGISISRPLFMMRKIVHERVKPARNRLC